MATWLPHSCLPPPPPPHRLMQLKAESQKHKDMAIFPESSVLPESEHLLYQLGWAEGTFSYRYLLRTKDRSEWNGAHCHHMMFTRNSTRKLQFRKGLYKKQKRQDWDHKAYIIIMMHQVLYNVHVTLFIWQLHNI